MIIILFNKILFIRKLYKQYEDPVILNFIKNNNSAMVFDIKILKKKVNIKSEVSCSYINQYLDGIGNCLDNIKIDNIKDYYMMNSFKFEKIFDKFLLKILSCNKNYEELKKLDGMSTFILFDDFNDKNLYYAFYMTISFNKHFWIEPSYNIYLEKFSFTIDD